MKKKSKNAEVTIVFLYFFQSMPYSWSLLLWGTSELTKLWSRNSTLQHTDSSELSMKLWRPQRMHILAGGFECWVQAIFGYTIILSMRGDTVSFILYKWSLQTFGKLLMQSSIWYSRSRIYTRKNLAGFMKTLKCLTCNTNLGNRANLFCHPFALWPLPSCLSHSHLSYHREKCKL